MNANFTIGKPPSAPALWRRTTNAFADDEYLRTNSWIAPRSTCSAMSPAARAHLGCGHGMASVRASRRGAVVTALRLSLGYVREAQARADANRVPVGCSCAMGAAAVCGRLLRRIWGNAILHHLDLLLAAREVPACAGTDGLRCLLRNRGVANRWLNFARRALPTPESNGRP